MNQYLTMGDVRIAAREYGMTLEQFFFETDPDLFDAVDWNNEEPSESLDDRIDRLIHEMGILLKYGFSIPDRLSEEYGLAMDEWYKDFSENYIDPMDGEIGPIEDYATEEDIKL